MHTNVFNNLFKLFSVLSADDTFAENFKYDFSVTKLIYECIFIYYIY